MPRARLSRFVETLVALSARPAAPSWLISMVVHMLAVILLALTFSHSAPGSPAGLTLLASLAEAERPGSDLPDVEISPQPERGGESGAANVTATTSPPVTNLADALRSSLPLDPTSSLPADVAVDATALEAGRVATAQGMTGGPNAGAGRGLNVGGKAKVGFLGTEGEGYKFAFVIDRSASMGGSGRNALDHAKAALLASLEQLGRTHQFQIVFYNERPSTFNPTGDSSRLSFATEQNKSLARKFLGSVVAEGGTHHEEALKAAISLRPDVIFFLTDADEPKLWPADLEAIHRRAGGITINTIEFGFGPQTDMDNFLVLLARQNGGKHAYVDVTKLLATGP